MNKDKTANISGTVLSQPTAPTKNKTGLLLLYGGGYITILSVLVSYLLNGADFSTLRTWLPASILVVLFGINLFLYLVFFKLSRLRLSIILLQIVICFAGVLFSGTESNISNLYFIVIPMIVLAFSPVQSLLLGMTAFVSLYMANMLLSDFGSASIHTLPQAGGFLFFGVVGYALVQQQKDRRRAEGLLAELEASHSRLRVYSLQVEELAVEKERNRMAREIHDNLGHYLVAVTMQLEAAGKFLNQDKEETSAAIKKAEELARESLSAVRESVSTLRKSPVDSQDLSVLADALVRDLRDDGIAVDLILNGEEPVLSVPVKTALFRTIQEGLTNVRKHAGADIVSVIITCQTDRISVEVQDNGTGIQSNQDSGTEMSHDTGFGLLGLTERISLLKGSIKYGNNDSGSGGFLLSVTLPLSGVIENAE